MASSTVEIIIGITGGGGILSILGWYVKSNISSIKKDLDKNKEKTVFKDTCEITHKGVDQRLSTIETNQKYFRNKIDEVSVNTAKILGKMK